MIEATYTWCNALNIVRQENVYFKRQQAIGKADFIILFKLEAYNN